MDKVIITSKEHPHFGETGIIKTNANGNVVLTTFPKTGIEMFEITLVDCPHGVSGCMVQKSDVKLIVNTK